MRAPSVKDRIGVRNHKLRLPEELAFGITVQSSGEATLDTAGISDHRITKIAIQAVGHGVSAVTPHGLRSQGGSSIRSQSNVHLRPCRAPFSRPLAPRKPTSPTGSKTCEIPTPVGQPVLPWSGAQNLEQRPTKTQRRPTLTDSQSRHLRRRQTRVRSDKSAQRAPHQQHPTVGNGTQSG